VRIGAEQRNCSSVNSYLPSLGRYFALHAFLYNGSKTVCSRRRFKGQRTSDSGICELFITCRPQRQIHLRFFANNESPLHIVESSNKGEPFDPQIFLTLERKSLCVDSNVERESTSALSRFCHPAESFQKQRSEIPRCP
jgi:hypothetical protein